MARKRPNNFAVNGLEKLLITVTFSLLGVILSDETVYNKNKT